MVCRTDSLLRTVRVVAWGVALVPILAGCQEQARQDRVTTQDGVTGGYVQPPQPEQAPIDYGNAKPMPMPSIDGPPAKPDPRDAEIKYPGPSGSEEGSAGEGR